MQEVEAIKDDSKLSLVKAKMVEKGQLYADIFDFGLNTALRINDLLSIKFCDIDYSRLQITIVEMKTKKSRIITLNECAFQIVNNRLKLYPDHTWLFQVVSNRSKNKAVSSRSVARIFQEVGKCRHINLHLGTHSMRKTRGYFMRKNGSPIEEVSKMLNHSNPAVTMRYVGLDADVVASGFKNLIL